MADIVPFPCSRRATTHGPQRASNPSQVPAGDAMVFRARATLTVLGMSGAIAILVAGSWWRDAFDRMIGLHFGVARPADLHLGIGRAVPERVIHQVARLPGVIQTESRRSVEDEGRTRVKDRYLVSAPVSGRLARPTLRVGDAVHASEVLLTILPQDPALIDRRTSASLAARADAARAALAQARAEAARARAAKTLARSEAARAADLARRGFVSESTRENAELTLREREQARVAAEHAESVAGFELSAASAALQRAGVGSGAAGRPEEAWLATAPVDGLVLKFLHDSEQPVLAGEPLLELGDLRSLEVVVDVLSTEASGIQPGQPVRLTLTRRAAPLIGQVRRIEPVAHTRVSALGIDEQRVPVLIDLPADTDPAPGGGWRVDAAIIVETHEAVPVLPAGALIRERGRWQVFVEQRGRVSVRPVTVGGLNPRDAWISGGLAKGDQVVMHPPDGLREGSPVRARPHPDAR